MKLSFYATIYKDITLYFFQNFCNPPLVVFYGMLKIKIILVSKKITKLVLSILNKKQTLI